MPNIKCPYCDRETTFQVQTVFTGQLPIDKLQLVVCSKCFKPIGNLESELIFMKLKDLTEKVDHLSQKS